MSQGLPIPIYKIKNKFQNTCLCPSITRSSSSNSPASKTFKITRKCSRNNWITCYPPSNRKINKLLNLRIKLCYSVSLLLTYYKIDLINNKIIIIFRRFKIQNIKGHLSIPNIKIYINKVIYRLIRFRLIQVKRHLRRFRIMIFSMLNKILHLIIQRPLNISIIILDSIVTKNPKIQIKW